MGQSKKARLNLTMDPAVYQEARQLFNALDLNMSGFVETVLAQFLQRFKPFMTVLLDPNVSDAEKKLLAYKLMYDAQNEIQQEGIEFIQTIEQKFPTNK